MLSLTIRRLGVCAHLTQPCYIKMCAEMRSVVKRIKKNQVIITALAIMIAVAGYINYAGNISDIISVSGRGEAAATDVAASDSADNDISVPAEEPDDESMMEPGSVILTSGGVTSGVISEAKLNREQIRAKNTENRPLFIGQSVMNTVQNADPQTPSMNQLPRKMALQRAYQTIGGSCQWPASAVVENAGKYRDALMAEYHKYPALPPVFDFMDNEAPDKVRKMKPVWTEDGYLLFWTAPKYKDEMDRAVQYVIYRFDAKEKVDISDPSHIVAITRDNFYKLPYENGKTKYRYVVTALDRLHNESKIVAKKVKL